MNIAVVGTDHGHVVDLTMKLVAAGAEVRAVVATDHMIGPWLASQYPDARTDDPYSDDVDVVAVRIGGTGFGILRRHPRPDAVFGRNDRDDFRPRRDHAAGQFDDVPVVGSVNGEVGHAGRRVFSSRALSRMMRSCVASSNSLTSTA